MTPVGLKRARVAVSHGGFTYQARRHVIVGTGCPGLSLWEPSGVFLGTFTLTFGAWERLDGPLAGPVGGPNLAILDGIWLALRREEWS